MNKKLTARSESCWSGEKEKGHRHVDLVLINFLANWLAKAIANQTCGNQGLRWQIFKKPNWFVAF